MPEKETDGMRHEIEEIVIRLHELARLTGNDKFRFLADNVNELAKKG